MTDEQLAGYRRLAEGLERKNGANKAIYGAITELCNELERVRAQLDAVPVEGEVSIPTGKPQPTQDENSKAEFRIKRIDAMYAQYGNDRNTWPWPAQETFAKLDAAQTEYEAKYC